MIIIPLIDVAKCQGCGLCVTVCQGESREIVNNVATITNKEACVWCRQCEAVCPTGAASCPLEIVIERRTTISFRWERRITKKRRQ